MKLALDLGARFGYCFYSPAVTYGHITLPCKAKNSRWLKFAKFAEWLDAAPEAVDGVFYEVVRRHAGTGAAHCYGAYEAILGMWCLKRGLPLMGYEVREVKYVFTGNGGAGKADMMARAVELGFAPAVDDEADAIAVMCCGLSELGLPIR